MSVTAMMKALCVMFENPPPPRCVAGRCLPCCVVETGGPRADALEVRRLPDASIEVAVLVAAHSEAPVERRTTLPPSTSLQEVQRTVLAWAFGAPYGVRYVAVRRLLPGPPDIGDLAAGIFAAHQPYCAPHVELYDVRGRMVYAASIVLDRRGTAHVFGTAPHRTYADAYNALVAVKHAAAQAATSAVAVLAYTDVTLYLGD